MLDQVKADQFKSLIGKEFEAIRKGDNENILMTLEKVSENENCKMPDASPDVRTPFSLLFKSSAVFAVESEVCTIKHEGMDDLENVFINRVIPPNQEDSDSWYEAVFC